MEKDWSRTRELTSVDDQDVSLAQLEFSLQLILESFARNQSVFVSVRDLDYQLGLPVNQIYETELFLLDSTHVLIEFTAVLISQDHDINTSFAPTHGLFCIIDFNGSHELESRLVEQDLGRTLGLQDAAETFSTLAEALNANTQTRQKLVAMEVLIRTEVGKVLCWVQLNLLLRLFFLFSCVNRVVSA